MIHSYNEILGNKEEVPIHAIPWMNLENIMLSKRSVTEKTMYYMIQLI